MVGNGVGTGYDPRWGLGGEGPMGVVGGDVPQLVGVCRWEEREFGWAGSAVDSLSP